MPAMVREAGSWHRVHEYEAPPSNRTITPTGIPTAAAAGTPTVYAPIAGRVMIPTGIPSAAAVGTPALTQVTNRTISPTGIPSAVALGNPTLSQPFLTDITHGEQLVSPLNTGANTGVRPLLGASWLSSMETMTVPGRGYWRSDTPAEFSLSTPYVYDNNPANKGGIVPAGGMVIDGFAYPAGTRVVQFRDFSAADIFVSGSNNFLFRGTRHRNNVKAPGNFNCAAGTTAQLAWHFCDMGGLGPSNAQYNEIPLKVANASRARAFRCYFSYTTTAIQFNIAVGAEIIENYIEHLTYYYGPGIPPGESTDKHLNGVTFNGGETCALVLRNYVVGQNPDGAGRTIMQTDCISFFQDFGQFSGAGTNSDGTVGYQVHDNYVGGTGFCIYAGKNAGSPAGSVNNMKITGTKMTTTWWPNGGWFGPVSAVPPWGTLGNVWSNNTWADGPNAGTAI